MNNQAAQTMPEPVTASVLADLIDWHKRDGTKKGKLTTQALQELAEYRTRAATLSQTAGVHEPGRYFAGGPQGHFFADDLQLARDLVNLYDKDDDWTITDLRNPTGAAPSASGGEDGWKRMTAEARAIQMRHLDDHKGDVYHAMQSLVVKHGYRSTEPMMQPIEPKPPSAAPASSAHPDALPDGTLSKSTAKRVEALAASGGECPTLHPATEDLIRRFSDALREKLSSAEKKYGYSDGWASPDWMDQCRRHLDQHVAKGDPRDVAAYCAFLWHHGEPTTKRDRDADRKRFPDDDFNAWLDVGISDAGHTVYDSLSSIEDAWQGWHGHVLSVMSDENSVFDDLAIDSPTTAASVSERARASKQVHDMLIDLRAAASIGRPITGDELHELEQDILRALEQALTQQRVEVLDRPARVAGRDFKAGELVRRVVGRAHAEYDRHHGGCLRHPYTGELRDYRDVESDPDGTLCVGPGPLAATTPQPSADAARELVRRWRELSVKSHRDGQYQGYVTLRLCADELESMLSAASGEKGVG